MKWFYAAAGLAACLAACCADDQLRRPPLTKEKSPGEPRVLMTFIIPFFRQYQEIDWGKNLNNLKSTNTATFFIVRDAMTVSLRGAYHIHIFCSFSTQPIGSSGGACTSCSGRAR